MPTISPKATTTWEGKEDFETRRGPMTVTRADLEAKASNEVIARAGYAALEKMLRRYGNDSQFAQLSAGRFSNGGMPAPWHMLHMALTNGNLDAADACVKLGAPSDLQVCEAVVNWAGKEVQVARVSAMALAVMRDSEAGRLAFLPVLAATGDLHQIDSAGRTLAHCAFSPVVVRYLMDAGLSLDTPDVIGETPRDHIPPAVIARVERGWLASVLSAAGKRSAPRQRL